MFRPGDNNNKKERDWWRRLSYFDAVLWHGTIPYDYDFTLCTEKILHSALSLGLRLISRHETTTTLLKIILVRGLNTYTPCVKSVECGVLARHWGKSGLKSAISEHFP